MDAARRVKQRRPAGHDRCAKGLLGTLHLAFLIEVRGDQPLMQGEGVARRLEHHAAIDDAQRAVHAQPKPFEHGGEVPGVDRQAVDRGLAAHRLQAGAVEESRAQRVTCQCLIEPRERSGRALDGANGSRTGQGARKDGQIAHDAARPGPGDIGLGVGARGPVAGWRVAAVARREDVGRHGGGNLPRFALAAAAGSRGAAGWAGRSLLAPADDSSMGCA